MGNIVTTVTDEAGNAVQGAQVTVVASSNQGSNWTGGNTFNASGTTNAQGVFTGPSLPNAGFLGGPTYSVQITVQANGYAAGTSSLTTGQITGDIDTSVTLQPLPSQGGGGGAPGSGQTGIGPGASIDWQSWAVWIVAIVIIAVILLVVFKYRKQIGRAISKTAKGAAQFARVG